VHRVVGRLVGDAVRAGEGDEGEDGPAVLVLGPDYALGPEVARGPHQVDEVPAAVPVAPLPLVGVEEVAVQEIAHELVVELEG
jgi:hypothetical protein